MKTLSEKIGWLIILIILATFVVADLPKDIRKYLKKKGDWEKFQRFSFIFGFIIFLFAILFLGAIAIPGIISFVRTVIMDLPNWPLDGTFWEMARWVVKNPVISGPIILALIPFLVFFLKDAMPFMKSNHKNPDQTV